MNKSAFLKPLLTLLMLLSAASVPAQDFVGDTRVFKYIIGSDGVSKSLVEKKSGLEWLDPSKQSFASVKVGWKFFPVTALKKEGDLWRAEFGSSGVKADFRIESRRRYLVIELVHVTGANVEELRLAQVQVRCREKSGWWLGAAYNEKFALCLLGLSDSVDVRPGGNGMMLASVYPEFGMEGRKVALVASPTPELLDVIQKVEHDFDLPSPKLGGQWAKTSRAVHTGYLFTDLTEANADETIRFAKLGGFEYIMTYDGTWAKTLGSYPVNTNNFPLGEESLKATVDKCHRAGLKVGLHCLTSFVHKHDALVRPKPDPRLLKDDQATLGADVDDKTNAISSVESLAGFPTEGAFYGDGKAGFDIQIDDELIQYRAVGGAGTNMLMKCLRGYAGTKAAAHKAGAKISHLVERYGCYLVDLKSSLKGEVSERISGIVNRCGFDMIYFDGGECNGANGPYWYWVSKQQDDVCRRFKREVLVQGSGGTHWTWHWFARGCCDDFAAIAPKQYLDYHKIADSWASYTQSFMPAELGWWGFLAAEPHQPATSPDEVEFYAVRMLALNTPVSLETHLGALKRNGRTEEMLKLLGEYEQLRLKNRVPAEVREKLKAGEWHLLREGKKYAFAPVKYDTLRVSLPGDLNFTNSYGEQPLKFRLQAVPALAQAGDKTNIVLLRAEVPLELKLPEVKAAMPGALAGRIEFAKPAGEQASVFMVGANIQLAGGQEGKPLNMLKHRALAVRVRVDGQAPGTNESCAVLNVQLEAGGKTYRDNYIDLNFTGERTIIIPEPNTERMLPEFRPAGGNYAFKAAMYGFNYGNIVALNLRWMRLPKNVQVSCHLACVEALGESDAVLTNPVLCAGEEKFPVKAVLKAGDYVEFMGEGPARVFDWNGVLLSSFDAPAIVPKLREGVNRIMLLSDTTAAAKLTVVTTGVPIRW